MKELIESKSSHKHLKLDLEDCKLEVKALRNIIAIVGTTSIIHIFGQGNEIKIHEELPK